MRPIVTTITAMAVTLLAPNLAADPTEKNVGLQPGRADREAVGIDPGRGDKPQAQKRPDRTDERGIGINPGRFDPHEARQRRGRTREQQANNRQPRNSIPAPAPDRDGVMPGDNVHERRHAPSDKPDWQRR